MMLSLNKWDQREVYSEIDYVYYDFLLALWDYLIAHK
jgi:hypothetical protein